MKWVHNNLQLCTAMMIDPLNSGAARPSWATAEACSTEGDHVGACLAVAAGSNLGWVMKIHESPIRSGNSDQADQASFRSTLHPISMARPSIYSMGS